jgi:restriction endonuclease Mrr
VFPSSKVLLSELLKVLQDANEPLSGKDIDDLVAKRLNVSPEAIRAIRSGSRTEFSYRLAWERTHAKQKGLIARVPGRKWVITESGKRGQ